MRTIGDVSLEEEDGNSMLVGVSEPLLLLETHEGNESSPSTAWLEMAWFDGRVAAAAAGERPRGITQFLLGIRQYFPSVLQMRADPRRAQAARGQYVWACKSRNPIQTTATPPK